jgi:Protein of unknown function (DUF2938)
MIYLIYTVIIGTGATALMDLWTIVRKRLYGTALPNYGYVGRWIGHMRRGRFHHEAIAKTTPVRGEHIIGWLFHYVTGISFAALLIGVAGIEWMRHPTIGPAIAVGILTVAAPFLLMQPAMGAGIAASRTPRPAAARVQSLITHTVFGVGLYVTGWVTHLFYSV